MMRALPSYATYLGLERDAPSGALRLPWSEAAEGRPGFIHGGLLASLLEIACHDALVARLDADGASYKMVNLSVDFLRGGVNVTTFARAEVTRFGKRIAHLQASAWQDDPAQPIARSCMHFLMSR